MNTVYFKNKGIIDLSAVTTFGVNVKENENPFGFFGTGLKYAIAILLRENQAVIIYTGTEKHEFTTVNKNIRGKSFDIICMDDRELGFTLELGKTWALWQAYRELYCNTLDEDGEITTNMREPGDDETLIVVEGEAFFDKHCANDKIILQTQPHYQAYGLDIHLGASNAMHMKTVRVRELPQAGIFTYNMTKPVQLTEDRTVKNDHEADAMVRHALISGDCADFIRAFATAPKDSYEQKLDCNWSDTASPVFMETIKNMKFKDITNLTILDVYRKHSKVEKKPAPANMTDVEKIQLEKSIAFCKKLGYEVDKHPINVTDDLNEDTLGKVYLEEIYLSRRVFLQGTKQVATTLLEEHMHIDMRYRDETYDFQTYLFDVIVSLGERLNGEPL